jgi:hypothetical protein
MKKFFMYLMLLMTFLFISPPSVALGKLGHQLVCQLAYEHLPTQKQAQLNRLLASIPANHQHLINHYNYKKQGSAISFANACTWADAIKRIEDFKAYGSWHYMNVPRSQRDIKANTCQQNCLPQAILQHQQLLSQGSHKGSWQQTQALLFLGHWLGDIHQPLHISFASDLGGNQIELAYLATKCSNLHWYWDDCILYRGKHSKKKWLQVLTTQWEKYSTQNWQPNQVWQWADESFQLVKSPNFHYCQINNQGHCLQPEQKVNLPKGYLKQYQPMMEERLLLAAQRLTKILEASL